MWAHMTMKIIGSESTFILNYIDLTTDDTQAKASNNKCIGHQVHTITLWYKGNCFIDTYQCMTGRAKLNVEFSLNNAVTTFMTG